jgi:membrane-associated phospholipid phosphatase
MNTKIVVVRRFCFWLILLTVFSAGAETGSAQTPLPGATPISQASLAATPTLQSLEKQFFKNILRDQKAIWTYPFHLRGKDGRWLVPFSAATAALIATDRRTSSFVSRSGNFPALSRGFSQGGTFYATGGIAAGFYLFGRATNNYRARETGLLSAEALIDSGIVAQGLKFITQRPRPNNDNGRGRFFRGGNSFPSGHATSVWSLATVIAYEYHDRPLVRYGAFAMAAAVSLSRYTGRNHFLSDVLVGGAIGYGIGRFVYHKRHVEINQSGDELSIKKTSKIMPMIVPIYERRTGIYGGTLAWSF